MWVVEVVITCNQYCGVHSYLGALEYRGVGITYINQTIWCAVSTHLRCAYYAHCNMFLGLESLSLQIFVPCCVSIGFFKNKKQQ